LKKSISKNELVWGYSASILNVGAGIVLLPIILRYLQVEDVGLWFVFLTLASLVQLLEMGYQQTITRNVAYVYAGAQDLNKEGLPEEKNHLGKINVELLTSLTIAARLIYRIIALLASIILLICGTYYIETLITPNQNKGNIINAWILYSLGHTLTFYFGYIIGFLNGRGAVTQCNKITIITRGSLILLSVIAVVNEHGLLGLGWASLMSAILGRLVAYYYFKSSYKFLNTDLIIEKDNISKKIIKVLWHNASRLGGVQVGAFLVIRGNILIASSTLGLAAAASFAMTITLLMTLIGIATAICQLQLPRLSAMQFDKNPKNIAIIYGQILIYSYSVYIFGLIILIAFGGILLESIGSTTQVLEPIHLILLGIIFFLEMNHGIAATYLTTLNKIQFLKPAIISGLMILIFASLSVFYFGIIALILSQGIVQLFYNNWKWPLEASKNIGKTQFEMIKIYLKS
jgi:O-antigen/teichoic acid export membrane protein